MDDKIKNFKYELRELLKKYDAQIWVELDGDTHGVSSMIVIDIYDKEVMRSYDSVSHNDIK